MVTDPSHKAIFTDKKAEAIVWLEDKELDLSTIQVSQKYHDHHYFEDTINNNEYIDLTSSKSKYAKHKDYTPHSPIDSPISDIGYLLKLAARQSQTASHNVYLRRSSKDFWTASGRIIHITMPKSISTLSRLGKYRIIESNHYIDKNNNYRNTFSTVPSRLRTIPIDVPQLPKADSLFATIIGTDDPNSLRRVMVDFLFPTKSSGAWLRVMNPDVGLTADSQKNRGFIFIPEKDSQVIVSFEPGNSNFNFPYVMGSIFHGKNGMGRQADNHIKSIITRSRHTIEFDDADSSLGINIKAWNGKAFLDTKGKNIEITAPATITMNAKNISMNAEQNITGYAGQNINLNADENLESLAAKDLRASADNIFIKATTDLMHTTEKHKTTAEKVRINSTSENLELASNKEVEVQSAKKIKLP